MTATATRLEPGARALRASTIDRLERLAGELARRGLSASMMTPGGRTPRLQVTRPTGPDLVEDVYARRCEDGAWWFWWAWAEPIAATSDLAGAGERIQRLLTAQRTD